MSENGGTRINFLYEHDFRATNLTPTGYNHETLLEVGSINLHSRASVIDMSNLKHT